MSRNWSSFENDRLIMESWRRHLNDKTTPAETERNHLLQEIGALKNIAGLMRGGKKVAASGGAGWEAAVEKFASEDENTKRIAQELGLDQITDEKDFVKKVRSAMVAASQSGDPEVAQAAQELQANATAVMQQGVEGGDDNVYAQGKISTLLAKVNFLTPQQKQALIAKIDQLADDEGIMLEAVSLAGSKGEGERSFSAESTRELEDLIGTFNLNDAARKQLLKVLNFWGRSNTVKFEPPAPRAAEPEPQPQAEPEPEPPPEEEEPAPEEDAIEVGDAFAYLAGGKSTGAANQPGSAYRGQAQSVVQVVDPDPPPGQVRPGQVIVKKVDPKTCEPKGGTFGANPEKLAQPYDQCSIEGGTPKAAPEEEAAPEAAAAPEEEAAPGEEEAAPGEEEAAPQEEPEEEEEEETKYNHVIPAAAKRALAKDRSYRSLVSQYESKWPENNFEADLSEFINTLGSIKQYGKRPSAREHEQKQEPVREVLQIAPLVKKIGVDKKAIGTVIAQLKAAAGANQKDNAIYRILQSADKKIGGYAFFKKLWDSVLEKGKRTAGPQTAPGQGMPSPEQREAGPSKLEEEEQIHRWKQLAGIIKG